MNFERCLICGQDTKGLESQASKTNTIKTMLLDRQLSAVFVLRDLLEIPSESLQRFLLLSDGTDPASWMTICESQCQDIVKKARKAYSEMSRARHELMACQKKIRDRIRLSSVSSKVTRYPDKDYKVELSKLILERVSKKAMVDLSFTTKNFSAGDGMADQLLAIRLAISHQSEVVSQKSTTHGNEPKLESVTSTHLSQDGTRHDSGNNIELGPVFLCKVDPDGNQTTINVSAISPDSDAAPPRSKKQRKSIQRPSQSICSICGKQLSSKSLKRHVRSHANVKDFKCVSCPKMFGSADHLRQHQKSHSNKRPFPCHHCDEAFKHKAHLVFHLQRHDKNRRTFPCDKFVDDEACPAILRSERALITHRQIPHDQYFLQKIKTRVQRQQNIEHQATNAD